MTSGVVLTALLAAFTGLFLQAEQHLRTLNGSCSIAATIVSSSMCRSTRIRATASG